VEITSGCATRTFLGLVSSNLLNKWVAQIMRCHQFMFIKNAWFNFYYLKQFGGSKDNSHGDDSDSVCRHT